ncbi:hypothetical protein Tco_1381089 [Tanacetum coccineum]
MPPRMTTRSAGQAIAALQEGRTGGRTGRGGGRTRGRSGDQGNGSIDGQGGQVGGQGSEVAKVAIREMVGIKTAMPSMTTSVAMLGMSLRTTTVGVIADTLTDEAIRNGSLKKNPEKRGNRGEPSKDR